MNKTVGYSVCVETNCRRFINVEIPSALLTTYLLCGYRDLITVRVTSGEVIAATVLSILLNIEKNIEFSWLVISKIHQVITVRTLFC